jgi:hypothetical protein
LNPSDNACLCSQSDRRDFVTSEGLANRAAAVVRLMAAAQAVRDDLGRIEWDLADARTDLMQAMREAEILTLVADGHVFRDFEDGERPLQVEPVGMVIGWDSERSEFRKL